MAPYTQRCRDCSGQGCTYCGTGFIEGNGEANSSRGQLMHRQASIGAAGTTPLTPTRLLNGGSRTTIRDTEAA